MADYAEPLKCIWERVRCPTDTCGAFSGKFAGKYCKGHAALLEMVDVHAEAYRNDLGWDARVERERRRLRTSVGVSNG